MAHARPRATAPLAPPGALPRCPLDGLPPPAAGLACRGAVRRLQSLLRPAPPAPPACVAARLPGARAAARAGGPWLIAASSRARDAALWPEASAPEARVVVTDWALAAEADWALAAEAAGAPHVAGAGTPGAAGAAGQPPACSKVRALADMDAALAALDCGPPPQACAAAPDDDDIAAAAAACAALDCGGVFSLAALRGLCE